MAKITMIPATRDFLTAAPINARRKRRVAAYARVSTDSDEQFTSYEAQVDYYTQLIRNNPDWVYVNVYTDEGISGLNAKKRKGFNQMVQDALDGKIDLIVTKSLSRFARNTVDSLQTIRKLKDKGVECFFEKENIYTFDGQSEVMLTIMSSLAQEESRSISENVTWGQRKRFADGKLKMPYKHFLGYEKGPGKDGTPVINEEQAEIVLDIYEMFMSGMTPGGIAKELTSRGILSPAGKAVWRASTIESILTNEKYKGDALLQKKFTINFLEKKMKLNEGEVQQYYVENSHPAIISPSMFDRVQKEMARRKAIGRKYSGKSVFSCRIICGDCGEFYGSKTWNSTDKYARTIWQCNHKFQGEQKCSTPHLDEAEIKDRFLRAFNQLIPDREEHIENCRMMQTLLTDCTEIDKEITALAEELMVTAELIKKCISENARQAQDQDAYLERYNSLADRYEKTKARIEALEQERTQRNAKADEIGGFLFALFERSDLITEFDERLWTQVIESATVFHDGRMIFKFMNGAEIEA